ncbi:hypothetical protein EPK97_11195 [Chengkuizengella sediminis]|nr:hypothetical protein [Chengkuizengella sediminis]
MINRNKITHIIEITNDNELRIAILRGEIIGLKNLWMANIGLIPSLIVGYFGIFISGDLRRT